MEVEGLGLAPDRERYNIAQHNSAEIRVGIMNPDDPGCFPTTWVQCITCSDVMDWTEDRLLFECYECGHTVSRTEAKELCEFFVRHVEKFSTRIMPPPAPLVVKRRKRWFFLWLY